MQFLKNKSKLTRIIILLIVIAALAAAFFYQRGRRTGPSYTTGYRLVREKISRSAPIVIQLPKKMDKKKAQQNVKFNPEIEGKWLTPKKEKGLFSSLLTSEPKWGAREIAFQPEKKLNLDRYYSVQLAVTQSEKAILKADFKAVKDPEIVNVFPKEGSEAPERSEITIVFNRPMVPLTTLNRMEGEVPVEIEPETKGKFKWTTTRNLQFIPEEDLIRSSHYKIRIKSGLTSMGGLPVKGQEREFTTRKLRHERMGRDEVIYDQPFRIYFNQPVDLDKTKSEIELTNTSTGERVPFVLEYPKKTEEEKQSRSFGNIELPATASLLGDVGINFPFEDKEKSEQSVIELYPKEDKFGRDKLWNFNNNYELTLNRAYPTEGDITMDDTHSADFKVPGIIRNISAESDRTKYADNNFFDPQGKLWISFYEDINLSQSDIEIPKVEDTGYGKKCKKGQEDLANCEKVADHKKIYVTFKEGELSKGEELKIEFNEVVNEEGLTVNKEPLTRTVEVYPEFEILSTKPFEGDSHADLTELVLCSNSPILAPERKQFSEKIQANLPYEINSWGSSWRVHKSSSYEECNAGEFHTTINYGLMPTSDYSFELNLKDVFGQKVSQSLSFRTGEMPERHLSFYHFQDDYNVTPPSRTELTYAVKNMEYVNLKICKMQPLNFLKAVENEPSVRKPLSSEVNCSQVVNDRIDLPERYWVKNYFKVDLKDYFQDARGHYILSFNHPEYRADRYRSKPQLYERTYLNVTNLSVAEKKINRDLGHYDESNALSREQLDELNNLYWVTGLDDLKPIADAQVKLYQRASSRYDSLRLSLADTRSTTKDGIASTEAVSNLEGVIVSKGGDSTVIPQSEGDLEYARPAMRDFKTYLYTDKPIYRPDQKIFIKGTCRSGYDGNYSIPQEKVTLKVYNSKHDEILSRETELNEYGTFDTEVLLDKDAPLGMYRACVSGNCTHFSVQEYTPAPFKVKAETGKKEYVSKDEVNIKINADYYFGAPVKGGKVKYTFSSQDYYFDKYSNGHFSFGQGRTYPYGGEKFLLRGETSLNENGKATVSEELDFKNLFEKQEDRSSKIMVADLTVQNSQGQTVSTQKSFIMHAGEFYLGLNTEKSFLGKDESTEIRVKSTDTDGNEISVEDVKLNVYKTKWIRSKRLGTDGRYHSQWKKEREVTDSYEFDTDENGSHSETVKFSEEGRYEVEVKGTDSRGNTILSTDNIYVYGEKSVSIRDTEDTELELEVEDKNLKIGDQGEVIIKSPYQEAKALIAIERGKVFDYEIRKIEGNLEKFNFEVKPEHIPNVHVSALLVSSKPEIKFGSTEFHINNQRKELKVEVDSDQEHYLPGEEVTLDVTTENYEGERVPAELSMSVVDLSVLALKGNPKKNPLVFFYDGFPLTVSTASNIKDILVETEISTKGGGGGGKGKAPSSDKELARKKRGTFKETAFWKGKVRTGQDGKAQVTFTLPDNLTTWRTESVGLTKDTEVGVDYQQFISRKKLMVTPLKPRFVVPGDTFYVGAKVFNQSSEKQSLKVQFQSSTLTLKENSVRKFRIGPDESKTVYYKVKAPGDKEKGEHVFTISAKDDNLEDTVQQTIDITRNNTYEVTATANYTSDSTTKEYVFLPDKAVEGRGNLTIESSATLAVFLSDALNSLIQNPYGCSEQIASKLKAIATVKKSLDLPNLEDKFNIEEVEYKGEEYSIPELVEVNLNEIYNNQQGDGGFSYWKNGRSNFYLTLHLINSLQKLSSAGFEVNESRLNEAADYAYEELNQKDYLARDKNTVILTSYALLKVPDFDKKEALRNKVEEIARNDWFINDEISNTSLAYLAIMLAENDFEPELKNDIYNVLQNRIEIDARGAFLDTNDNRMWQYYETSVKNTALYLKALTADKRDPGTLDKTLRWLLNSKSKGGGWGSTNNTMTVVDSFSDFLKWQKETQSDFTLNVKVNDQQEGKHDFTPDNILSQFKKQLPLKELKFSKINTVEFLKSDHNNLPNNLYYDMALKYYLPTEQIPSRDEGISITRKFYRHDDKKNENPVSEAEVGEVLRGHIQITVPETRKFVMVEDYIPAGMELVNLDLATEQKSLRLQETELEGRKLRADFKEMRDDKLHLYKKNLSPGVYEFEYYVRALTPGEFTHLPAKASEMYFPENFGRTPSRIFKVKK